MSTDVLIGLELLLTLGLVVGWGFWELYALRRARLKAESAAGHPERQHALNPRPGEPIER